MRKYLLLIFTFFALVFRLDAQSDLDRLQLLSDLKTISSDEFEGRKTGTEGNRKARELILERYKDLNLASFGDSYEIPFSFKSRDGDIEGINLVGYILGKTHKDRFIAISAHYDHLGKNKKGEIFNGADDNASGVVGMLAIASFFQKNSPSYSIVFFAFDAEEMGLQGAKAMVKQPPFVLEKLKLLINFDMISINDKNEIYASGTYHSPSLKAPIESVNKQHQAIQVLFGHDQPRMFGDWTYASDQGPFHRAGIPTLYFGVEDHPYYHKPSDTFDKTHQVFFVNTVNFLVDLTAYLDSNLSEIIKK